MDLLQWVPIVSQTDSRPGQAVPKLEIRAWLRCLFCGHVTDVGSTPSLLAHFQTGNGKLSDLGNTGTYLDSAESRTHKAITQIKQQRSCDECGMVSILPPAQAQNLTKDVLRVVTLEWIAEQIKAVHPPELQLRHDLKDLVNKGVQKALIELDIPGMVAAKLAKAIAAATDPA